MRKSSLFLLIFVGLFSAANVLGGLVQITRIRSTVDMVLPEGNPQGLTYHPDRGTLFIVANEPGRLIEMTMAGDILATYPTDEYTTQPQGVAYDWTTGNLLVCKGNELIYEVDPNGNLLHGGPLFTTDFQLNADGIAVNPITGNVFLGDDATRRVIEVNREGNFLRAIRVGDVGILEPQGLSTMGELILVADDRESTRSLHLFDLDGNYIEQLIQTEPVGVEDPEAVAAVGEDQICVAGQRDNRVVCFDIDNQEMVDSEYSWLLEGSQVPVATMKSGICHGRLDPLQEGFDFVCQHDVVDVTKAEIRRAVPGDDGPLVFMLGATTTTAARVDGMTLERGCWDDFIQALHAGNLYVLISSESNPDGELRGQIPAPPHEVFFPQFGTGSGFFSDIVIVGASNTTATGTAYIYDRAGNPMSVPFIDGAGGITTNARDFTLDLSAKAEFSSDPDSDQLFLGSSKLVSSGPVDGIIRFNLPGVGIAGVGASPPMRRAILPARNSGGIRTGVAVRNNSLNTILLHYRLINPDGSAVPGGVSIREIPAGGGEALFVDEIDPAVDLTGFDGALVLEVRRGSFSAIGLELGNNVGEFTTLPVDRIE